MRTIKAAAAAIVAAVTVASVGVVSAFAQVATPASTPDYSQIATGMTSGVSSAQSGINGIAPLLFGIVAFIAVLRLGMRLLRGSVGR
jgi:hypothetical protein